MRASRGATGAALGAMVVLSGLAAQLAATACSSSSHPLAGLNQECFLASDCQAGLVCIGPPNGGERKCTDDLSGAGGDTPRSRDSGLDAEAGEGGDEGGAEEDAPVTTDQDTGTTETPDTGIDTGTGTPDTGAPDGN